MASGSRILVVDDDSVVLFVLTNILETMGGCQVLQAGSLKAALGILDEQGPVDAVVTDIRLTDGSGVELSAKIVDQYPDMPIVWVTAHGCGSVASEMHRLGVAKCLDKPLDIQQIRRAVLEAMDR